MKTVYIILALLLLLCLAPMPYGYFMIVRLLAMVFFAYSAYRFFTADKDLLAVVFVALALLFQPFLKIALGRHMWNTVDVAVAVLLLVLSVTGYSKKQ
jgi:hypothetical protein